MEKFWMVISLSSPTLVCLALWWSSRREADQLRKDHEDAESAAFQARFAETSPTTIHVAQLKDDAKDVMLNYETEGESVGPCGMVEPRRKVGMGTILDFAEANAKVNADFHIALADSLQKESNVLLSLSIAGASGLAAFLMSLAGRSPPVDKWQLWATAAAAAYLFLVSVLVLRKCLWIGALYAPANEPKNIPIDEVYPLDNVRAGELLARQECIRLNIKRNDNVAWWLNCCRALAAATPVFSGLVGLAVWAAH